MFIFQNLFSRVENLVIWVDQDSTDISALSIPIPRKIRVGAACRAAYRHHW